MVFQSFTILRNSKVTLLKQSSSFKFSPHPKVSSQTVNQEKKNKLHPPLFHTSHATHKEEGEKGNMHSGRGKVHKERALNVTGSRDWTREMWFFTKWLRLCVLQ